MKYVDTEPDQPNADPCCCLLCGFEDDVAMSLIDTGTPSAPHYVSGYRCRDRAACARRIEGRRLAAEPEEDFGSIES